MVFVFDLDDTLVPEVDYVRSAYRAIAVSHGLHILDAMLAAPGAREAFDSTGLPVGELLEIYRTHRPDIRLPWQSLYTLASLRNAGCPLAVVTDGRSVTQRNKAEALGLGRFIPPDLIFISEEVGEDKTSGTAFRRIMERFPGERYVYVGDNPAKDFALPRSLGWSTVALLDRGDNIHPQDFSDVPPQAMPDFTVHSLTDILDIFDI